MGVNFVLCPWDVFVAILFEVDAISTNPHWILIWEE
jgi:hypothetical protein